MNIKIIDYGKINLTNVVKDRIKVFRRKKTIFIFIITSNNDYYLCLKNIFQYEII